MPHILFTVHAFASHRLQPALKRRLLAAVERALDRVTDGYGVGTRTFRGELERRRIADASRVEVIPLGIEFGHAPDAADIARARAALGLGAHERVIAAAGRFERQKGFAHLIDAMARVAAAAPDAHLLLFGDGPLRPQLEAQAASLGLGKVIRFAGWRDDLPALLPAAEVFCLSSLWEAFGYVLLDAMAARVPIVATAVDGVPEVLDGGRLGALVAPADPAALADALLQLLADPRRRAEWADAGRRELESRYPVASMIRRHEAWYERLASPDRH